MKVAKHIVDQKKNIARTLISEGLKNSQINLSLINEFGHGLGDNVLNDIRKSIHNEVNNIDLGINFTTADQIIQHPKIQIKTIRYTEKYGDFNKRQFSIEADVSDLMENEEIIMNQFFSLKRVLDKTNHIINEYTQIKLQIEKLRKEPAISQSPKTKERLINFINRLRELNEIMGNNPVLVDEKQRSS